MLSPAVPLCFYTKVIQDFVMFYSSLTHFIPWKAQAYFESVSVVIRVAAAQTRIRSAEGTCSAERRARSGHGQQTAAGERRLCAAAGPAGCPPGAREQKAMSARSSDTKPGHAEIIRPAQWVANKRGALLILHQLCLIFHSPP